MAQKGAPSGLAFLQLKATYGYTEGSLLFALGPFAP